MPRGESWKARAPESTGSVQALAVGITALGADRVVADKARTYFRQRRISLRLSLQSKGLVPWVLRTEVVYILMNSLISRLFGRLEEGVLAMHVAANRLSVFV